MDIQTNPICKPNAIIQAPTNPQILINTPFLIDNQFFPSSKIQVNIDTQQLNINIQPSALKIKFDTPTINGQICTDVQFLSQTQIVRDISEEGSNIESYTDSYMITPTQSTQVLFTNNKYMKDNLIINPIPKNYGLVTWNGSYLTIS